MFDSLLNMNELAPFVTGLLVGIAATLLKRGVRDLPKEVLKVNTMVKAAIEGRGNYKLVFVVRDDLNMTKGKIASQCAHATLLCYETALKKSPENVKLWSVSGQAKIVVKLNGANCEREILKLAKKADELGIVNAIVRDAGRTQVGRGTVTVLGLGPSPSKVIDQVSGHLKLM